MESREEIEQYLKSELLGIMPNNKIIGMADRLYQQNKQLLDEIDELKSKLILSEEKVKLNYNCIIDLQSELKDKDIDLQHYKKMASNNNHF